MGSDVALSTHTNRGAAAARGFRSHTGPGDKCQTVPVQPQAKQSTSALQPSSHSSTCRQDSRTTSPPHTVWMVSGQLLRRTQGNSSTYMVNEETLALFSHCENKRCNRNVTHLRANPWQVAEDGPLCQGHILPPTNISSCSVTT